MLAISYAWGRRPSGRRQNSVKFQSSGVCISPKGISIIYAQFLPNLTVLYNAQVGDPLINLKSFVCTPNSITVQEGVVWRHLGHPCFGSLALQVRPPPPFTLEWSLRSPIALSGMDSIPYHSFWSIISLVATLGAFLYYLCCYFETINVFLGWYLINRFVELYLLGLRLTWTQMTFVKCIVFWWLYYSWLPQASVILLGLSLSPNWFNKW